MAVLKKGLLAGLALALVLSAAPSIANADEGDTNDETASVSNDPGITALHKAVDDMRDARTTLRVECPNMKDAKCKTAFAKVRDEFKVAQKAAIAKHHEFKQEQKKARDEAKQKAKDVLKDKAAAKAKDALKKTPKPSKPSAPPLG